MECEGCGVGAEFVSGGFRSRPITFEAPRSARSSQRRRPTNPEDPVTIAVLFVKSEGRVESDIAMSMRSCGGRCELMQSC